MALLLKNAHVIDPQVGLNETADILIRDGKIVEIGQGLSLEKGVERDLAGKIVVPGLVDMHVHLREPGFEQKEDIASAPAPQPMAASRRCAPCPTPTRSSTTPSPSSM